MCTGYETTDDNKQDDFSHKLDLAVKENLNLDEIQSWNTEAKYIHDNRLKAPAPMTKEEYLTYGSSIYSETGLKMLRRTHEIEVALGQAIDQRTDYLLEIERLKKENARLSNQTKNVIRVNRDSDGKFARA